MSASQSVEIARRFCGPPQSGNGGYCVGVVASALDGPCVVTLRQPPPLDVPLTLEGDGASAHLHQDGITIATGEATDFDLDAPPPPALDAAQAASARYPGFERHPYPTCFVCGPQRAAGDGLRIFSGALDEAPLWAAPWRPDASLGDDDGQVDERYVWAALDCPSYFALGDSGLLALLGRMTGRVDDTPRVDEACTVVSWPIDRDGRKHRAAAAVYGADGRRLGVALSVWIALKPKT